LRFSFRRASRGIPAPGALVAMMDLPRVMGGVDGRRGIAPATF
jgi:hypothetical protein